MTQYEGQTRVTIPKVLAALTGIDRARVVEMWFTEQRIIHIKEYHGEEQEKRGLQENQAGPD